MSSMRLPEKKAVPNVEVSVPDKNYEAGDDLPDLILGKDTPSGSVSWVVDEVKKLTEGDNTLTWEYTPDDENYDKVTGTLVINASPKQTTTTAVTTTTGGSESSVSGSGTETTVSTTDVTSSTVDSDSTATGTGTDQSSGNGSATTTSGSATTTGTGNGSGTGTTGTSGSGNGSDTTTASSTDNSGEYKELNVNTSKGMMCCECWARREI